MVGDRAGESAALVAEELAVEQGIGRRPAVHRQKRMVRARAAGMDGARHELLPGAALARDQNRADVLRDRVDGGVDRRHRRTGADQLAEPLGASDLGAQAAILVLEGADVQQIVDRHQQLVGIARLHQVVVRAELHGFDRGLRAAVAGQDDGRG